MVGMAAAGAAIGGGLYDIFGGGSTQPTVQPNPVPYQTAVNALNNPSTGIAGLNQYNLGGQYMPAYQQAISQYLANPYGSQPINAANLFAPQGVGIAQQGITNAQQLGGTVGPLLQQAFDPQQALYQRTAGQVSDAEQAQLAASGLGQTPWGAGAYGQTMSDFNLNWQDRLLQRMLSGTQGAEGAAQGAFNLGTAAPGAAVGAAGLPFQTYGQVASYPLGAYSGAAAYGQQASQVPQTAIGDWVNYLGQATGAQNAMTNLYAQQLQAQKQQFGEQMLGGAAVGSGLGALAGTPGMTGIGNWWQSLTQPAGGGVLPGGAPLGQGGIGSA